MNFQKTKLLIFLLFFFFISCGKEGQFQKDHITKLKVGKRTLGTSKNKKKQEKLFKVEIFSDFKCPACNAYWNDINNLKTKFNSKVDFTYNYYPLSYHKDSFKACLASICAKEQGKEWEYINKIYTSDSTSSKDLLFFAEGLGLNLEKFKNCYNSKNTENILNKIKGIAKKRNIFDVPTIFINKSGHKGKRPYEFLEEKINKEIEKQEKLKKEKEIKKQGSEKKKEDKNKKSEKNTNKTSDNPNNLKKEVDKIQEEMKNNKEREEIEKNLKET